MKVELTFSIEIEQTFFVKLSSLGILYIYIILYHQDFLLNS